MSFYGPIHPNQCLAEKACADAEFATMRFHEVKKVRAIYSGDRLIRPAGYIVVDVNDQVSLMKEDLGA